MFSCTNSTVKFHPNEGASWSDRTTCRNETVWHDIQMYTMYTCYIYIYRYVMICVCVISHHSISFNIACLCLWHNLELNDIECIHRDSNKSRTNFITGSSEHAAVVLSWVAVDVTLDVGQEDLRSAWQPQGTAELGPLLSGTGVWYQLFNLYPSITS